MADAAALLLAAGRSTRFGPADKLLAPLNGRPLVLHAARALIEAVAGDHVAVCSSADVAALLKDEGWHVVMNDRPDDGMGRSVAMGIAAVQGAGMVLLALADMPRVTVRHLAALLSHPGPLAATGGGEQPMPPARFDRSLFGRLGALSGSAGARGLLRHAALVPADPATLFDVDRVEDLDGLASSHARAILDQSG